MREADLMEREKKIIGQKIVYLDYLFTNAIREYGVSEQCYAVLHDLLAQMIALANAVGVNVVTLEDLNACYKNSNEPHYQYTISPLRVKLYQLRAKLIAECVRQGVIESFKEIPISLEYDNDDH